MSPSGNVVAQLRDRVPIRPLLRSEAMRIAELQAQRFLALVDVHQAPVPERVIAELPRIEVSRLQPFPVSGASHWSHGRWMVALRASEPITRQRFSLAHEFKHILDHRFADVLYSGIPDDQRRRAVEQICDYFAGCLLMPRPWVKQAWYGGMQQLPALAARFGVSEAAMSVRLVQIGLIDAMARCDNGISDWFVRTISPRVDRPTYTRSLGPVFSMEGVVA